ncbi:MAG TPA: creatininase family protein [Thermomicrobiales bacterium]|nr:creatininase family protein [Thermomicrobiales bacterium]
MTKPVVRLQNLTWPAADEALRQRPVGLLPIGAIEAHGPHLPLDTDIIIAEATAERAAGRLEESGVPVIILPPIAYTVSFAGTSFAGTTPVEADQFEAYLASLLGQAARQGYRALICCNAHLEPEHVARVQHACLIAEEQSGVPTRAPDQRSDAHASRLSEEFRRGARHAGGYETSILLAVRPDVVDVEQMRALPPVWIDLPARLRAGARTFADAGADLAYFGDPARATAEEGHAMLDALADIIIGAIPWH